MSSQWSTGSISPPEGVTPNLVDPPNQLGAAIAVHSIFLTASTLAILMRVYTRIRVNRSGFGADDYLAIFSYLGNIAWSGVMFEAMKWGVGRHMWDEPAVWLINALKWETIGSWVYIVSATTVKLSFLFLYRRLFSSTMRTKITWFIDIGIVVCLCFNLGCFFGVVFFCVPVQKGWNNSLAGHCSNPDVLAYLTGAWNIFVDLYVLILPIPLTRQLNMARRQRARLAAIFSIGAFACIASIVRLGMTSVLQSNEDITYNMARVSLWATIEINVGLTCSCLILLPGFLRHHLPESTKSYLRSITWSILRTGKTTRSDPEHHGWYKQDEDYLNRGSSFNSRDPASKNRDHQILQTNDFTMEVISSPNQAPRTSGTDRTTDAGPYGDQWQSPQMHTYLPHAR